MFKQIWFSDMGEVATYHVTLPHYMCQFWQHEVTLTVQPPASNGQRSGHASHGECPDFVMQFLYMVRVGIAVQHFAASGLKGLIRHLNIKKKDISLPLSTLKMGDERITHDSCLSHEFHFAHIFHFHQVFGKEDI
jgi:hypothetical protein